MQFYIEKMTCLKCAKHVTQAIVNVDPGAKIEADPDTRKITLATSASHDIIKQALSDDGYTAILI